MAAHFHTIPTALLMVPAHVNITPMNPLDVINVEMCQSAAYAQDVTAAENKALVGLILSIRHISMSTDRLSLLTSGLPRHSQGAGGNNRARLGSTQANRPYERLLHISDLASTNGRVFCIICSTADESKQFFHNCSHGEEGVGSIILVEEPGPTSQTLGSTASVPIIASYTRVIPLLPNYNALVLPCPLNLPPAGDTVFFSSHGDIQLQLGSVTIVTAVCSGKLCDRQLPRLPVNARCGCYYKHGTVSLVLSMSVSFPVAATVNMNNTVRIDDFRSWRTSQLFVHDNVWAALDVHSNEHLQLLRTCVRRICVYINQHGGWSYIGWLRRGIVTDSSDNRVRDAENIASHEQSPHLSLLLPSQFLGWHNNAEFNALKLSLRELNPPPPPQRQQPARQQQQPARQQGANAPAAVPAQQPAQQQQQPVRQQGANAPAAVPAP